MAIFRKSANAPITYAYANGVKASDAQGTFNGVNYQEGKIIRTGGENRPIMYASPLVKVVRIGTSKPGLQNYTSP